LDKTPPHALGLDYAQRAAEQLDGADPASCGETVRDLM
jgi:hypothetical protein